MSGAKIVWDNECMDRLEQLEQIHRDARGPGEDDVGTPSS